MRHGDRVPALRPARTGCPRRPPAYPRCGNCHQPLPWIAEAGDDDFADVVEQADACRSWWTCGRPGAARAGMVSPALEQLARDAGRQGEAGQGRRGRGAEAVRAVRGAGGADAAGDARRPGGRPPGRRRARSTRCAAGWTRRCGRQHDEPERGPRHDRGDAGRRRGLPRLSDEQIEVAEPARRAAAGPARATCSSRRASGTATSSSCWPARSRWSRGTAPPTSGWSGYTARGRFLDELGLLTGQPSFVTSMVARSRARFSRCRWPALHELVAREPELGRPDPAGLPAAGGNC